jgi:hypothetical protein
VQCTALDLALHHWPIDLQPWLRERGHWGTVKCDMHTDEKSGLMGGHLSDSAHYLNSPAGTPIERLMNLLSMLIMGESPDLKDIIEIRSALALGSEGLFRPQDLEARLRMNPNLNVSMFAVARATSCALFALLHPIFCHCWSIV